MAYPPYPSRGYGRFSHPWPVDQTNPYAPTHPPTLLGAGGGPPHQQGHPQAQPYTIQDYLRSLGYGSQAGYLQGLGLNQQPYTPMSDAEIQAKAKALVDAQINPLLEKLNTDYAARTKMGSEAIQGLTQMLAGMAAQYGPAVGGAYDAAIGQGQQLEGALAGRLDSTGQGAAQETGAKLAAAGQDTTGATGLGDVGKFAGDAGFAKDTAALQALNAAKAADTAYGAKLPFIEGLTGAQAGSAFQSQLMAALGQDTASVTGQVPGLLQNIASSLMAQDQGKQDRSAAATQARAQATLGLEQNYVAARNRQQDLALHTKERGQTIAAQNRANAENTRRYNQQRLDNQNRQRLSIVAADAPTTRGRKAYWDAQAAARTRDTGTEYIGTPTGIRPVTGPGGKPVQTQAGQTTKENLLNAKVSRIATLGTVRDPTTGQLSYTPQARAQIKALTGVDPGQGPAGSKPAAPKFTVVGSDKSGRRVVRENPDGTVTVVAKFPAAPTPAKPNQPHTVRGSDGRYWTISPDGKSAVPVKGPPATTPKTPAPAKIDVTLSRAAGQWVDSTGQPVAKPPGKPPPPLVSPTTKKPVRIDLPLSEAAGRWVDSSGNPVNAPGLPPKPPAKKTSGSSSGPPKSFKRH